MSYIRFAAAPRIRAGEDLLGLTLRELRSKSPHRLYRLLFLHYKHSSELRWYALTVRHQHEGHAAAALQYKNLETLVPVYRTRRRWSDRMKELDLPLFAGYVFCRFHYQERVKVLS